MLALGRTVQDPSVRCRLARLPVGDAVEGRRHAASSDERRVNTLARGAGAVDAFSLPRGVATGMQVITVDPGRDAVPVELDLGLHLLASNRVATHGARCPNAEAAKPTSWPCSRQPAAENRFAGLLSDRLFVGRDGSPAYASPFCSASQIWKQSS